MRERPIMTPGVVFGAVVLAIGVVLLLDRQGLLDAGYALSFFWPAVLLLAGVAKLAQATQSAAGRVWGALLTGAGILLLLDRLGYLRLRWGDVWPLILIAIGVMLLWRALERGGPPSAAHSLTFLNNWTAFGGGELISDSKEFEGGEVFATFGGFDIDLRDADIKGKEAVIYANALFGGVGIRVPETWSVTVHGTPVLGGYNDKTRHPKLTSDADVKRLVVRGFAMFGGVEVKN